MEKDKELRREPELAGREMTLDQFYSLWNDADLDTKRLLIDYMIDNPSLEWREILWRAENGEIENSELIVDHSSELYSSIANLIADIDGLVR